MYDSVVFSIFTNCAVTTNIKIKTFSSPPKETCTPQGPFTTLPPRSRQGEPALGCRVDGIARRWPFAPGSSLGAAVACAGPSFIPAVATSQPAAWTDRACLRAPAAWTDRACLCAPVTAFWRFPSGRRGCCCCEHPRTRLCVDALPHVFKERLIFYSLLFPQFAFLFLRPIELSCAF